MNAGDKLNIIAVCQPSLIDPVYSIIIVCVVIKYYIIYLLYICVFPFRQIFLIESSSTQLIEFSDGSTYINNHVPCERDVSTASRLVALIQLIICCCGQRRWLFYLESI